MRKNDVKGVTLVELLVGLGIGAMVVMGIFSFLARYQRSAVNLASTTAAEEDMDALVASLKALWSNRGVDSVANCNCHGGADDNCPAILGGPCASHQLLTLTGVPSCRGLRIFRAVVVVLVAKVPTPQYEFRDFLTVCNLSPMPGVSGSAPSPLPSCLAGRPIVERRRNVNGTAAPTQTFPALVSRDLVAAGFCVTKGGSDYIVDINGLLHLSNHNVALKRRLILSPTDKAANLEFIAPF